MVGSSRYAAALTWSLPLSACQCGRRLWCRCIVMIVRTISHVRLQVFPMIRSMREGCEAAQLGTPCRPHTIKPIPHGQAVCVGLQCA